MNQLQIPPTALLLNALFEHGTDDKGQIIRGFDAWEKLGDGRGVTAGYCGFTSVDDSGTSDLRAVCNRFLVYQERERLSYLPKWRDWTSGDGLFKRLGDPKNPSPSAHNFRQAQLDVGRELYELPALKHCAELGIQTPFGIACIYDAIIQHGDGDDEDSLGALIRETEKTQIAPTRFDGRIARLAAEHDFTDWFNSVRYSNLSKPRDDGGTWFASRDRAHALNNLCRAGAWDLTLPLHVQSAEYDVVIR